MSDMEFQKNMFSELRIVTADLSASGKLSDETLCKAVTMNENLRTEYGYMFNPRDLVRIADADAAAQIAEQFRELVPEVKAKPMYPDFPSQVMEMSEAEFRFHQYVHYFSTYGMECLFGVNVQHGWLPAEDADTGITETKKTAKDKALFDAKTVGLCDEKDAAFTAYKTILSRRERMTTPEAELVRYAVKQLSAEEMSSVKVQFKENMESLFAIVMQETEGDERISRLKALCVNCGDVLRGWKAYLNSVHYKPKTSEKRAVVRLLETYKIEDFTGNLMLSKKNRDDVLTLLQYMDYNTYSRSEAHRKAVARLRDGDLRSWESRLKVLLAESPESALEFASQRPGELVRKANFLVKNGASSAAVKEILCAKADVLSSQTLTRLCLYFSSPKMWNEWWDEASCAVLYDIFKAALTEKLSRIDTPLRDKKVFIDEENYSFADSYIETNEKSQEGGYIRSGMAFRIPEEAATVRFFTYWNDKDRIDIDLHGFSIDRKGSRSHVGWNADYEKNGIVHSGDITHSNAAEFIDVNIRTALKNQVSAIVTTVHSFTGVPFCEIETVLVGMMAVSRPGMNVNVRLYDPKNCFFAHELRTRESYLNYCRIDLERRCLVLAARPIRDEDEDVFDGKVGFTLQDYLTILLAQQNASVTDNAEDADIVLKLGKPEEEKDISLTDVNYFLDAE